jgi:dihydrofolate reductase
MESPRKLYIFIAMSLDGYIAAPDGDISFLPPIDMEVEDYGYADFIENIDTVVLGRKTYDKILSMGVEAPYGDREVFVLTHSPKKETGKLKYYSGSLKQLILGLKSQKGKHIYCDGGADTIHQLLADDLIDEMTISIIPILLGEGIALFKGGLPEKKLSLVNVSSYENGLVKLHYRRSGEN